MSKSIEQVDKNFVVDTKINESDVIFYDPKKAPFKIYGLYDYENQSTYKRMPTEIAEKVNEGVAELHRRTAGGRLRFATDSRYIAINAVMPSFSRSPHVSLTGAASFDLYVDDAEGQTSRFYKTFIPPYDMKNGYESLIDFKTRKLRYVTVNFPSYSQVESLYIGLQADAVVREGLKYKDIKPIVYYGSSITQGACSSRPGNIYQNIICRRNGIDYINLGFSGNCLGEDIMTDYLASLDMSVLVCDYDHNAAQPEHLRKTHHRLYERFREKQPDTPFIMITKADCRDYESNMKRRDIIMQSFLDARATGDKNVYFIDGTRMYPASQYEMCTVDHCHPTDLGMSYMAEAIEFELIRVFTNKNL